jgi:hypothetical protein
MLGAQADSACSASIETVIGMISRVAVCGTYVLVFLRQRFV